MAREMKDIIYENRRKKQLTQEQLAEMLNISNKTVSKWERGAGYPDILLVPKLAEVLGISISELFDAEDLRSHADGGSAEVTSKSNAEGSGSAMSKYTENAVSSMIFYIFTFIIGAVAWFFEIFLIGAVVGSIMLCASLVIFISATLKFRSASPLTPKSARRIKMLSGIYSLLYYLPLTALFYLLEDGFDNIGMTVLYAVFLVISLIIPLSLKFKLSKKRNIIFAVISFISFALGFYFMARYGSTPIHYYIFSQSANYIALFTSNDFAA